jgi:hypothetical protein
LRKLIALKISKTSPFLLFIFVLSTFFTSCRDSDRNEDRDLSTAEDYVEMERLAIGTFLEAHSYLAYDSIVNASFFTETLNDCRDSVVFTSTNGKFPKKLQLFYGNNDNKVCYDGINRKGSIEVIIEKDFGLTYKINFEKLKINDSKCSGELHFYANPLDANGKKSFLVNYHNLLFTWSAKNKIVLLGGQKNYLWLVGDTTKNVNDDIFAITGSGEGRGRRGGNYTYLIVDNILVGKECNYFYSGQIKLTPLGLHQRDIEVGYGGCTKTVQVSIIKTNLEFDMEI